MSAEFQQIKEIASSSLMPDFFAVRIEEEGLWGSVQLLMSKIQLASPPAFVVKIKEWAAECPDTNVFVEKVKEANLWTSLREMLTKIPVQ